MSLLDKIKRGRGDKIPAEDRELATAWVNDEVTIREVQTVKKYKSPSAVYCYLANVLKKIIRGTK